MHTPNPPEQNPHGLTPTGYNARTPGYETSDVQVGGIAVFLISLFVFVLIFMVFCFGMGKVINNALIKHDGPANKWNQLHLFARHPGQESRIECGARAEAASRDDRALPHAAAADG